MASAAVAAVAAVAAPTSHFRRRGGGKLMGKLVWWRQSDVLRTLLLEHWERREWRRFTGELAIGAYHLLMNWAYSEK